MKIYGKHGKIYENVEKSKILLIRGVKSAYFCMLSSNLIVLTLHFIEKQSKNIYYYFFFSKFPKFSKIFLWIKPVIYGQMHPINRMRLQNYLGQVVADSLPLLVCSSRLVRTVGLACGRSFDGGLHIQVHIWGPTYLSLSIYMYIYFYIFLHIFTYFYICLYHFYIIFILFFIRPRSRGKKSFWPLSTPAHSSGQKDFFFYPPPPTPPRPLPRAPRGGPIYIYIYMGPSPLYWVIT